MELCATAALGLRSGPGTGLAFSDEGEVVYACGRNIIQYDPESAAQSVIHGAADAAGITAFALSPNRKLLAFAEQTADASPTVTIVDLASRRKKKVVTGISEAAGPPCSSISLLAFAADGRHLAVQTRAPDWTLHYVLWDRGASGRILASFPGVCPPAKSIDSLSIHPDDPSIIVLCGRGILRLLRVSDGSFKPVQLSLKRDTSAVHFTAQLWLSPARLVLGTSEGELWLFESYEFRRVLEAFPGATPQPVSSLALSSKGLLAGYENGVVRLFEACDDPKVMYRPLGEYAVAVNEPAAPVVQGDAGSGAAGLPSSNSSAAHGGGEVTTLGGRAAAPAPSLKGTGPEGSEGSVLLDDAPPPRGSSSALLLAPGDSGPDVGSGGAASAEDGGAGTAPFTGLHGDTARGGAASAEQGAVTAACGEEDAHTTPPQDNFDGSGPEGGVARDRTAVTSLSVSAAVDEDVLVLCASGEAYLFRLSSAEVRAPTTEMQLSSSFSPTALASSRPHTPPTARLRRQSIEPTLGADGPQLFHRLLGRFHDVVGPLSSGDDAAAAGAVATARSADGVINSPRQPAAEQGGSRALNTTTRSTSSQPPATALQSPRTAAAAALRLGLPSPKSRVITALASCARKPLFLTAGADRSVRLWNFSRAAGSGDETGGGGDLLARRGSGASGAWGSGAGGGSGGSVPNLLPSLELVVGFPEAATAAAIHPSGLQVLLAFPASLQLLSVLKDGLRVTREYHIKASPDVRFTHGGNLFAAVNGTGVNVYATYTGALLLSLKGHKDKVIAFCWSRDDRYLISASRDGTIIRWGVTVPQFPPSSMTIGAHGTGPSVPLGGSSRGGVGFAAPPPGSAEGGRPGTQGGGGARPTSVGGQASHDQAVDAAAAPGKILCQYEVRGLLPTALACGLQDCGRDVFVSGLLAANEAGIGAGGGAASATSPTWRQLSTPGAHSPSGLGRATATAPLPTPILRHIDLASSPKDAPKADVALRRQTVSALLSLQGGKSLVVGLGHHSPLAPGATNSPASTTGGGGRPPSGGGARASGPGGARPSSSGTTRSGGTNGLLLGGGATLGGSSLTSSRTQGAVDAGAKAADLAGMLRRYQVPLLPPTAPGAAAAIAAPGPAAPASSGGKGAAAGVLPETATQRAGPPTRTQHASSGTTGAASQRPGSGSSICGGPAALPSAGAPHSQELSAHAGAVTHMVSAFNDRLVISAGEDGTVMLFSLEHRAGARGSGLGAGGTATTSGVNASTSAAHPTPGSREAAAGGAGPVGDPDGGATPLPWSEDLLVTRDEVRAMDAVASDLRERIAEETARIRRSERAEAEAAASVLAAHEARFKGELQAERRMLADMRRRKRDAEERFEAAILRVEGEAARELGELEVSFSSRLGQEGRRYEALAASRDGIAAEYEASLERLATEHAAELGSITARFDRSLASEAEATAALDSRRAELRAEATNLADAIEDDVDLELRGVRSSLEATLGEESKATLLLRGENGFMKRRYVTLSKELSEQKDDIACLGDKEKELSEAISALRKDVAGHKKEIREREETVEDKEARIYDLKKKNQELEKFKFVLNYKIQELKRQIMPKKREIQAMREQMKDMELELLQYHKSNAALDLMIGEMRLKRDGVAREVHGLRKRIHGREAELQKIARDVSAVHALQGDVKALKTATLSLFKKYVHGDTNHGVADLPAPGAAGKKGGAAASSATGHSGGRDAAAAAAAADAATVASASPSSGGMKWEAAAREETRFIGGTTDWTQGARGGGGVGEEQGGAVSASLMPVGVDVEDVHAELSRQRVYYQRNVDSLQLHMRKAREAAAADQVRLRREREVLASEQEALEAELDSVRESLAVQAQAALANAEWQDRPDGDSEAGGGGGSRRNSAALSVATAATVATAMGGVRSHADNGAAAGSTSTTSAQAPRLELELLGQTAAVIPPVGHASGAAARGASQGSGHAHAQKA